MREIYVSKILIVENEWMLGEYYRAVVEQLGYAVCGVAATADEAVSSAYTEEPDLILMDVELSGEQDGVDAAIRIHRNHPIPTIYVTASHDPRTMNRIRMDHPTQILLKPVLQHDLRKALAQHCPLT
jgi:CheY-like chemotaxis protein